jgi:CHAT domain-containing protein
MLVMEINNNLKKQDVLFSEYSSQKYLINEKSISYAPSGYFIISKSKAEAATQPRKGDILLLSNPTKNELVDNVKKSDKNKQALDDSEIGRRYSQGFSPLPFSERECEDIGNEFTKPLLLNGQNATKKRFLEEAPHYSIIHLSTHGLFDGYNPLYSGMVFAPDYNNELSSILYAYELFNVSLNCDLVTLSACETGLGQNIRNIGGEGVYGLPRMLLASGAGAVVSSLWRVADESTAILMVEFYKNIRELGLNKSEALRQAKIFLKKQGKKIGNRSFSYGHPFFWAPFILIGNPN